MNLNIQIRNFTELDTLALYQILQLRNEVFIVEQACPYQDLDNFDSAGIHLYFLENDVIVAYCRILPPGVKLVEACITRVITKSSHRTKGFGKMLMLHAIIYIAQQWPDYNIKISAQAYLQQFYESFGFVKTSDIYLEDNIPHMDMLLTT